MIVASLAIVIHLSTRKTGGPPVLTPYATGDTASELGDGSLRSERFVLLWVQSQCKFCTASLPFYQRLTSLPHPGTRIVAMGPESSEVLSQYLRVHDVKVDQILAAPEGVRLYGTPTIMLVEPGYKVAATWVGQLPSAEKETEVIEKMLGK
jgi:hypothetical protein